MSDTDETERELRLELMRLHRTLKLQELRRLDQRLAYGPVKLLAFAVGSVGTPVAALLFVIGGC